MIFAEPLCGINEKIEICYDNYSPQFMAGGKSF